MIIVGICQLKYPAIDFDEHDDKRLKLQYKLNQCDPRPIEYSWFMGSFQVGMATELLEELTKVIDRWR